MAEKNAVSEIRKLLATEKLIFGLERTLKLLRQGKLAKVFVSNNCRPQAKEDLKRYCELGNVEFAELDKSGEELGTVCKKPFFISVIGVAK